MGDLTIRNLKFSYGESVIFENLNLDYKKNDFLAIVGPNGGGKSTLLSTLCRQLPPLSGEILLENMPVETILAKDFAKKAAILTTRRPRTELTTCREIVESGRYPYTGTFGLLSDDDHAAVDLAMREGWSTASETARSLGFGAGMGLPNMKRNADDFNITSKVGEGTTIDMRFRLA